MDEENIQISIENSILLPYENISDVKVDKQVL